MEGNKREKFRIFSRLEAPKAYEFFKLVWWRYGGQTETSITERNVSKLLSTPGIPNWQKLAIRVNNPIIPIK